jgi:hypothetical protein
MVRSVRLYEKKTARPLPSLSLRPLFAVVSKILIGNISTIKIKWRIFLANGRYTRVNAKKIPANISISRYFIKEPQRERV